jgi:hypothetical protein
MTPISKYSIQVFLEDPEYLKDTLDLLTVGTIVAVLVQWLPTLASVLAIVWTLMRMYEWVQRYRGKWPTPPPPPTQ